MNETTAKRVIKRQFNIIIDEEKKLKKILSMETDTSIQRLCLVDYIRESSST